jgi:hypothetical protein
MDVFSSYNFGLIVIGLVWILVSVVMDFRKREVANFWNFSLIAIALVYRAFLSIELGNFWFLLWGLIGLGVGFVFANLFYYMRMFAGGDAKLLMALGPVLFLSLDWKINLFILVAFLIFFLFAGGLYGLVASVVLSLMNFKNFKKQFGIYFKKYRMIIIHAILLGIVLLILGIIFNFLSMIFLGVLFIISPFLFVYASAVQEASLVRKINVKDLTIGDWLAEDVRFNKKIIKKNWQGLSEQEVLFIQKNFKEKVLVKYGIPFTPSFLIAYVVLFWILSKSFYTLFNLFG